MRLPDLRARVGAWWAEERLVGEWIRDDGSENKGRVSETRSTGPNVRSAARGMGAGFDEAVETEGKGEGNLRTKAKAAVVTLMGDGLKPSPHWRAHGGP